jgi:di/tricarboxylate transporter
MIHAGDRLLIVGRSERVSSLADQGITIEKTRADDHISPHGLMLIEVMPAPRSASEGKSLKDLNFRQRHGLTAIALWRKGRSYRTNVADFKLELGDSLLTIGTPDQLKWIRSSPGWIVLEPDPGDQPVQRKQALISVAVVLGAVAASIAGMPVYLAALAGAVLIVLTGLVAMEEAYRSVEWQAIFLVAGMYAVSIAMVQTGLAAEIGRGLLALVAPFGPLGLAAGAFLLTSLLTQVMGGQVAALVTGPIAISAAIGLQVNPQAIAVATAIGCSASFFTPLVHPVNMLMIAPANYTFGDFFRIGWRLSLLSFAMLLIGMALFWGL